MRFASTSGGRLAPPDGFEKVERRVSIGAATSPPALRRSSAATTDMSMLEQRGPAGKWGLMLEQFHSGRSR